MKLLIVGSRSIDKFDLSPFISKDVDTIICGGAQGIDSLAEKYADRYCLSKYIMRPKYHIYKRAAPLKRNEEMVNFSDSVLIVWDGASKGTAFTLNYAKKTKKPITLLKRNGPNEFDILNFN